MLSLSLATLLLVVSSALARATPVAIADDGSVQRFEPTYIFLDSLTLDHETMARVERDSPLVAEDANAFMDPIQRRQTTSKEILRRATRRMTAPRAYSSTTPCGGFAGQTVILRAPSGGYVGPVSSSSGPANSLNALGTADTAVRFTFSSVCQLVTSTGAILNTHSSSSADYLFLNNDVHTYSTLTCNGDQNNNLSCTRLSPAVAASFCLNGAQAVGFGTGCPTYATFVPVLVNA
ncbi:hypothetical protein IAU60_003922 [Kwoniella sp. DSM 27419]